MSGPDRPLQVGVVVPSECPPAWITAAVAHLAAVAPVCVRVAGNARSLRPTGWSRLLCSLGPAPGTDDPDQPVPLPEAGIRRASTLADVDVTFVLGVDADAGMTAPRGVWQLPFDAGHTGVTETLEDAGAVELALERVDGPGQLRPSAARVHRLLPGTTRARVLWRAAELPARAVRDLQRQSTHQSGADLATQVGFEPGIAPGTGAALTGVVRLMGRGLRASLRRRLQRNQWFVAVGIDLPDGVPDPKAMTHLTAPAGCFWADPFPVVDGDHACIFVEEWPYDLGRGILAALELDRSGHWRRLGTVLQLPHHLSHPFVFRWQGETWMMPESSAAGTLELYRCVDYPLGWTHDRTIMHDIRIVDATLHEDADGWWLFGNVGSGHASTHEELHLFFAETPLGPWTPHPANPVVSDPRRARPAGSLIRLDDRLCRPAQDCGVRYGHALALQQVLSLSATQYREQQLTRLEPADLGGGSNRMHTFNRAGWLTVVDGHRDRWRWSQ